MGYSSLLSIHTSDLNSEAEVETRLLQPLFADLGYPTTSVVPKAGIPPLVVKSGTASHTVRPDFLLKSNTGRIHVVVEAKDPSIPLSEAWGQAAGYALSHNASLPAGDRAKWLLLSNGHLTSLYAPDSSLPHLTLSLSDFSSGSPPYAALRSLLKQSAAEGHIQAALGFDAVSPSTLNSLFLRAHQLIWKKQKLAPADAFFEFCKFVFLKITEDKKRASTATGSISTPSFPLTSDWLQVQRLTSHHPVRDLFHHLRNRLETEVTKGEKKRIFEPNESLRLSADTCRELIKVFESVNLSSIDEDLNGRMFEVFLNEAVRGKDLGQYFTPRPLVEFITRIALLRYNDPQKPPKTIDACCGTAGFLIEVMAFQLAAIRNDTRFSSSERAEIESRIKNELLFGVEANERVARVARINMYLHGDGGSHIFHGDGLDNAPVPSEDMSPERVDEVKDHANKVHEKDFDLILTNPPFSMSYDSKEPDEDRILRQLRTWETEESFSEAAIVAEIDQAKKVKSNVLFLLRYFKLLRPGGEMIAVLDDTILNGDSHLTLRRWILDHFNVISIHSLPFNAFFKAKANVKTSVLHLRKKLGPKDIQGHVFMSISNNIGHDSSLKDTPNKNNLNDIFNSWIEWRRTGVLLPIFRENHDRGETLDCPQQVWLEPPETISSTRLDSFFYSPDLKEAWKRLDNLSVLDGFDVRKGGSFPLAPKMSKSERMTLRDSQEKLKYIEIGDVTRYGLITRSIEDTIDNLPSRGEYRIRKNDVLVAINNSSRGTVCVVPPEYDGAICTSGFLVIRPESHDMSLLLWYALRSEICRKQFYYLAQTASQPELKRAAWRDLVRVPIPDGDRRDEALDLARAFHASLGQLLTADLVRTNLH